ncbi:MAG: glycosyltransferase [Rikenellaceae bacterium]
MAKISVIIPIYNTEIYLRECLDSVVGQTLKDIEIICVNDGSTDSSLDIIKEYAANDPRIKIIDKANSGYGDSMNKGVESATGEYIGIVEPDDYVDIRMYEELYEQASKLDLDFIKADFNRFTGNGWDFEMIYHLVAKNSSNYNRIINPQTEFAVYNFIMNTWSGIYKREFLESNDIKHNTTPGASFQDNGLWFQTFMYATRVMFLNKPYYMNRRDNVNSSVHDRGKVFAMTREYEYIRGILLKHPKYFERLIGTMYYKLWHNYKFTFTRVATESILELLQHISKEYKDADVRGEVDWSLFGSNDLRDIQMIMKSPESYFKYTFVAGVRLNFFEKLLSLKRGVKRQKYLTIFGFTFKVGRRRA